MSLVKRKPLSIKLSAVEAVYEQADGTIKCIRTARKAARRTSQASEVMTEFSIVAFDRIGICFTYRDCIASLVIPQESIGFEAIAKVVLGLGSIIDDLLEVLCGAFPDDFPAKNAACGSIYDGQEVDSVFLVSKNVYNSSSSAVST